MTAHFPGLENNNQLSHEIIQYKKTTIYDVGNTGTAVEQSQKRGGIKSIYVYYI